MSYLDIGFNENLIQQDNTLQALNPQAFLGFTSEVSGDQIGSTFDGQYTGAGINAANITTGQMSFDRARGGELILGGEDNTNGTFSLRDETDQERIALNKDGMTINNGAITILTADNKTILDDQGLVSTKAFKSESVLSGNEASTTTSALFLTQIDVLSFNVSVTRPTNILILLTASGQNDNANSGGTGFVGIAIDWVRVTPLIRMHGVYLNSAMADVSVTAHALTTLQPGNHFIHAFFGRSGSGNTIVRVDSRLTYLLLGN